MHGSHQSAPPAKLGAICEACRELSSNLGWAAIPGSFRANKI